MHYDIGYFLSEILRNIICDGLYNRLGPPQQMSEVIRILGWAQQVNRSITFTTDTNSMAMGYLIVRVWFSFILYFIMKLF